MRPGDARAKRTALAASLSLLAFAVLTTLALVAWFSRVPHPWRWQAIVALVSALLGVGTSALLWRTPSRSFAISGVAVMVFSLVRVGSPWEWTWVSFALLSMTALLIVPLVNAAITLR